MEFSHRYAGASAVTQRDAATELAFAPDTLRAPTYFRGQVSAQVAFREAMSALHDVVIADLRFIPKDRTAYLAWREQQGYVDFANLTRSQATTAAEIERLSAEVRELTARSSGRFAAFYAARQKYFQFLYERDRELWFKLDPIITVHPDSLFFECFSRDESSYGRLSASYNVFTELGDRACGTTNIDYSEKLYGEFQKIRSYKATTLDIDPTGFSVTTSLEQEYREVKIDVPDTWVRGLLQVSSAMTMPAHVVELHPMDVHNICLALRRNKEQFGPRSLRFALKPGAPVSVRIDPWDKVIACPRSKCLGDRETEIRIWGRRRLHVLERLLPMARSVKLYLLGSGMPSFWVVDLGELSFTLGLSGWTHNNWSQSSNFDLLASREAVDEHSQQRVFDELGKVWFATPDELARATGLDRTVVASAMIGWTQNGRAMYDVERGVYRKRELTREPLPMEALRYANPREEAAVQLLHNAKVAVDHAGEIDGELAINGRIGWRGRMFTAKLAFDRDRRIASAECDCDFYIRNRLRQGPCEHMLALRAAHQRGVSDKMPIGEFKSPAAPKAAAPATANAPTDLTKIIQNLFVKVRISNELGNHHAALATLQDLERQLPAGHAELIVVRERIAEVLFTLKHYDEAMRVARQVLGVEPQHASALRIARDVAGAQRDWPTAHDMGERYALVAKAPDAWLALIKLCEAGNNLERARVTFDKALQAFPGNAELLAAQQKLFPPTVAATEETAAKPAPFWRRMINKITGKSTTPAVPASNDKQRTQRIEAAVTAIALRGTVPDRKNLIATLQEVYRTTDSENERLFAMVAAVKQLCRDLPSDQDIIACLREAAS